MDKNIAPKIKIILLIVSVIMLIIAIVFKTKFLLVLMLLAILSMISCIYALNPVNFFSGRVKRFYIAHNELSRYEKNTFVYSCLLLILGIVVLLQKLFTISPGIPVVVSLITLATYIVSELSVMVKILKDNFKKQ